MSTFKTGKSKGKVRSKSARAGTVFPVGRLTRQLRSFSPHLRLSAGSPVYIAAVIEYLSAEVLELAGNSARDNKRKRIKPRDIRLAIGNDTELSKLCSDVTFSEGGNMVNIHTQLIPGKNSTSKRPPSSKSTVRYATKVVKRNAAKAPEKVKAATKKPSLPVLSKGTLFLGQELVVLMGDISSVQADAVVHPTNELYSTSGQVGQVLLRAGGSEYAAALDSLKSQGNLAKQGAAMCDMFNVEVKKVIHCNCPSWNKSQDVIDLQKTIDNCLKVADRENLKSVALPSVGSGNAGWPKQLAAETILRSISRYFQSVMASSIKSVYFVLYDKESVEIYTSELRKLLDNSS